MTWIVAIIALTGVYLNARGKWHGFLFWLVSNAWWCWHNFLIDEYAQASLFASFWLLSLYGIYNWRKKAANINSEIGQQHKVKFLVTSLCKRILQIKKTLYSNPGRIKINWLIAEAKEILELMSDENKTD